MKKYLVYALILITLTIIAGAGTLKFRNTSNSTSDSVVRIYSKAGGEVDVMAVDTAGNAEFAADVAANTIMLADVSPTPTCASALRGTFAVAHGPTGVKDSVAVCAKDASNAYAWRTIY